MNKKTSTQSHSNDGQTSRLGGTSITKTNMTAMFVVVLIILISGILAYLQYASLLKSSQYEKYRDEATRMASQLSGHMLGLGDMVEHFARADSELVAAIRNKDTTFLREREANILKNFPDANRVRYVLPGDNQIDNTVSPPLSFACLELARMAEGGNAKPPFEVHLFGGEIEHLDMSRPVKQGDELLATLIITLDVETLKSWVDALKPAEGYTVLQQGVDEDLFKLFGYGDESLSSGTGYSALIENTYWQVEYWPASSIGMAEARHMGFFITIAAALAAVVIYFLAYGPMVSKMLYTDLGRMVNIIIDIGLGKRVHSYPVKFAEIRQVLQEKENDLSVISSYAETKGAIHSKAESYMPDISFGDRGISVEEMDSPPGKDKK